jgi:hypothetical protein
MYPDAYRDYPIVSLSVSVGRIKGHEFFVGRAGVRRDEATGKQQSGDHATLEVNPPAADCAHATLRAILDLSHDK